MPKKVGTENWRKKRRQEYLEMKEFRYYIFCEGEQTEPLYFSGFKKLIEDNPIYRDMVLIQIEPCGAETMRLSAKRKDMSKITILKRDRYGACMTRTVSLRRTLMGW